jgi:hypothetical protein
MVQITTGQPPVKSGLERIHSHAKHTMPLPQSKPTSHYHMSELQVVDTQCIKML